MRLQTPLHWYAAVRWTAHAFLMIVLGGTFWGFCVCQTSPAGEPSSWIFRRSQFSHDPSTGARVAQYSRVPPVEPLPDPRLVTSGYRRTRTNVRGTDGSLDSYYSVSSYGNGLGGLDAEWERFHDAWLQSFTAGGYFQTQQFPAVGPYGYPGPGFGAGGGPYGFPPTHPPHQAPPFGY